MNPSHSEFNVDELSKTVVEANVTQRAQLDQLAAKIRRLKHQSKPTSKLESKFESLCKRALRKFTARQSNELNFGFPADLPVVESKLEIAAKIQDHQVVIIAGETGSGKTTQLPKICLELGLGRRGLIGHTQPRRLAARAVADRIAEEVGQPLGKAVGYQVRFADETSDSTSVKLMTDGILLAELATDPLLSDYEVIIIDEAHERSLNIDFLLGYLKQLLPKRPDLKLVVTSATIDVDGFSKHFNEAPIIEVSGRSFPVDVIYQPLLQDDEDRADLSIYEGIVSALEYIEDLERNSSTKGDVLVFLPGEREIRETHQQIKRTNFSHIEVLPLYSRLSAAEQNKVFKPHRGRRIVLSTNVAETSLTVPGIVYVIDPGLARVSRYSYKSKVQRLPIEAISQASANQRAGRCGRVAPGTCIRLYSEEDYSRRPEFTEPEILRSNLSTVILQMTHLRLGSISEFGFLNAPEKPMINDGYKRLEEIGAIDRTKKLTPLGRQLSSIPIDPHLARMLFEAHTRGALREVLIIVSALSIQDPRERPADKRQAADQAHSQWKHDESDFLSYVNLWKHWHEQAEELSQNQLRKYAKKQYLSYLRMREWRDVHHQLHGLCRERKWSLNKEPASFESVHSALASGLLSHVAQKEDKDEYNGARGRKYALFPGSAVRKKRPNWILAGSLLETSRLFAHTVARIEPEWITEIAQHVIKTDVYEPYYSVKHGRVMAYQRSSLYGLILQDKKRVPYDHTDAKLAREIFIRECLVAEQYKGKGKFYPANLALKKTLQKLEDKTRRRDLVVEDDAIYEFYNERLPESITSLVAFETWRKQQERQNPRCLHMEAHHLEARQLSLQPGQFPNELTLTTGTFKLTYRFEPGHAADGVSIHVPLQHLATLREEELEWGVPGILRDKCIALIKSLPKQYRRQLVPVPDVVDRILLGKLDRTRSLTEVLGEQIQYLLSVNVPADAWTRESLDDYYRLNVQVFDDRKRRIASSRDIEELRRSLKQKVSNALQKAEADLPDITDVTEWTFGDLPVKKTVSKSGVKVTAFPAIIDGRDSTTVKLFDDESQAYASSVRGVSRLSLYQLNDAIKQAKKSLFTDNQTKLALSAVCPRDELIDDLLLSASRDVFNWHDVPRDKVSFEQRITANRSQFLLRVNELEGELAHIFNEYARLRKVLRNTNSLALTFTVSDIIEQWKLLLAPGFLWRTPSRWLAQYPRYLKAAHVRIEQVQGKVQKDKLNTNLVNSYMERVRDQLYADGSVMWESETALVDIRFMMEEWRIQLFAQPMKTILPVSEKRIKQALAAV